MVDKYLGSTYCGRAGAVLDLAGKNLSFRDCIADARVHISRDIVAAKVGSVDHFTRFDMKFMVVYYLFVE